MKKKFNLGRFLRTLSFATVVATLSCMCVVGVFARYKEEMSGNVTVGIAKFEIQVTKCPTEIALTEKRQTADFEFTVKSNSEVEVSYSVVLTLPPQSALPQDVTFMLSINEEIIHCTNSENVYTFADTSLLQFAANDNNMHALRLTVNATDFSRDVTITDVRIDVVATQVQPT